MAQVESGPVTTLTHFGTFEVINNEKAIMALAGKKKKCKSCVTFCTCNVSEDIGVATLLEVLQNQWLKR